MVQGRIFFPLNDGEEFSRFVSLLQIALEVPYIIGKTCFWEIVAFIGR